MRRREKNQQIGSKMFWFSNYQISSSPSKVNQFKKLLQLWISWFPELDFTQILKIIPISLKTQSLIQKFPHKFERKLIEIKKRQSKFLKVSCLYLNKSTHLIKKLLTNSALYIFTRKTSKKFKSRMMKCFLFSDL